MTTIVDDEFTPEEAALFAAQGVPGLDQPVHHEEEPVIEGVATVVEPPVHTREVAAAAVAALPEPDAAAQAAAAAKTAPPPGFVPHEALHATRAQLQEAQRREQLLQTRMNAMLANQQPAEAPAMPDLETQPVEFVQALHERLEQMRAEQQQSTQYAQMDTAIDSDEQLYAARVPDYPQASEHYVQSRGSELLAMGRTPTEAQAILQQEVRDIARQAWQSGVPFAERLYTLARHRGYTPGGPTPLQQLAPKPPASGVAPAAALDAVRRAQAASRTLSGGQGGTAVALNAEAIANMTEEEFEAYLKPGSKGANARFAAITGG